MAKSKDEKKRNGIIPEPTLRRLPWYLSFVKLLQTEGHKYVSSPRIASGVGVDAALVAKDLSYVELQGRTRVGYETEALINYLEEFLGFTKRHQAFLIGVGSLGSGLLSDKGLRQFGLEVTAGFDVAEDIIGTEVSGIPVSHEPEEGKLWFTTVRRYKGLEAKAVLLVDVCVSKLTGSTCQRLIYVGSSRATAYLEMLCLDDVSAAKYPALTAQLGEEIEPSPQGIASWLGMECRVDG